MVGGIGENLVDGMGEKLELETRRSIYDCIKEFPGIHLREIQRKLEMPMGLLEYHLLFLERNRLVSFEKEDRYKRFYPSKSGIKNKAILSLLRQDIPRKIIILLLEGETARHGDLLGHLEISPSTLSFHLKKMVKAKVVHQEKKGRTRSYSVIDRETVIETLITYQDSFLDELVDRFAEMWLGISLD